jgi:predicted DNA-binding protein (MmcQ/YjbR family)
MLETPNEATLARLRSLCLSLPETSETASWGHPNFQAGKKTFVAFERVKGRASIAFRLPPDDVERLLQRKQFFATPYGRGLWASVWADGPVDWRAVDDLVKRSYRVVALKRMITALDAPARQKAKGKGQR